MAAKVTPDARERIVQNLIRAGYITGKPRQTETRPGEVVVSDSEGGPSSGGVAA